MATLVDLSAGTDFNEEDFNSVFDEFDKDGSGTVEKNEMAQFVKQMMGV